MGLALFVIVLGVLIVLAVLAYNRLVGLTQRSAEAWSDVDVQLKRRTDLVPNLVEAARGYASHERETFDAVIRARGAAVDARTPDARARAEGQMSDALPGLFAVAESYPELRAGVRRARGRRARVVRGRRPVLRRCVSTGGRRVQPADRARDHDGSRVAGGRLDGPKPRVVTLGETPDARSRRPPPILGRSPAARRPRATISAMRILFVCTANLDRSPAAELVLRELRPHVHETRSAGTSPAARRQIGGDDLDWADVVVVMEDHHREAIARRWPGRATTARVLGIPDRYQRDDAALRSLLEVRLRELLAALEVV